MTVPGAKPAVETYRRFLQAFSSAIKQTSLYNPGHPVSASSCRAAWQLLHDALAEGGAAQATVGMTGGRWVVNGTIVAQSAGDFEVAAMALRAHAIKTITLHGDCRLYEFQALCELAATPAHQAYENDAGDFLKERGVRRVEVNLEEFVARRKVALPATALVQNPLAEAAARLRSAAPKVERDVAPPLHLTEPKPQSFGSFIKSIVEKGVRDPNERARVYAEALRYVEGAVKRRVGEATTRLTLEKQGVINERLRAEGVLTTIARGRVIVDEEGRILMMDATAEEIAGRKLAEVAGKPLSESAADGDRFAALSKDLVLRENVPPTGKTDVSGASDALEALRGAMAVVHDQSGRVVGTFGLLPHAAKVREAQRVQDEFVANLTHDLKAPLASICSALELLKGQVGKTGPEAAEFVDISLRNSKALQQMINELLDFSRLKSGQMTVRRQRCDARGLVEEAVRGLTPWAKAKSIRLIARAPEAALAVSADHARVVEVLNNLISNAIKFTPENGSVTVSAAPGAGERSAAAVFCVVDTGCGIPLADQRRLFERFAQGSSREGGVGLGLAIARELVGRQGGQLWVESEPGKGAAFSFTLPLER